MKYFVVSYGGVGTHMLMPMIKEQDWLGSIIKRNEPSYMKYPHHLRVPPKSFKEHGYNGKVKIIYVFGDPINSVLSHFRRRSSVKKDWAHHHCINVQGEYEKFDTQWNLESYLNNGEDLFKLEEHFDNWVNIKPTEIDYDLMIVKYESANKHEDQIKQFLNTSTGLKWRKRNSDWRSLGPKTIAKLKNIYSELLNKVNGFEEIKTLKNETCI